MDELGNANSNPVQMMESLGLSGFLQAPSDPADRKSCCAALYQSEPVRLLLGDTLHPGGLALTHRLGKLVNIRRDDLVLDVACGRGASALAIARSFHCRVVGVDLGKAGVDEATRLAMGIGMDGSASFLCGDGEYLPLRPNSFDAALCECSMSLFPDKARGVAEIAGLLRTGGRLGVSDVTVEPGCLPEELRGTMGQMFCLADAPSVGGYEELLAGHGLTLIHQQDASESIMKLVGEVEGKLAAFRLLFSLQQPAPSLPTGDPSVVPDLIFQAFSVVDKVKTLVANGAIGYWLFVAEKGTAD